MFGASNSERCRRLSSNSKTFARDAVTPRATLRPIAQEARAAALIRSEIMPKYRFADRSRNAYAASLGPSAR